MTNALVNLSRRQLLGVSGTLVLGASLPRLRANPDIETRDGIHHLYVSLDTNASVSVVIHRSEMGQGVRTSLAQIVADELDADWERVSVMQAQGHPKYGDQNTDGSKSIRLFYDILRTAGAAVREMLVQAAANKLKVDPSALTTANHEVLSARGSQSIPYADLVGPASHLEVPSAPKLKKREDHTLIGKAVSHVDAGDMARGSAIYGADVRLPNMAVAVIVRPPSRATKVDTSDLPREARTPAFIALEDLSSRTGPPHFFPFGGVAVVAKDTASAMKMAKQVKATWTLSHFSSTSSTFIESHIRRLLERGPLQLAAFGNPEEVIEQSDRVLEALYTTPMLAHAPMEPPVAIADVRADGVEVWAPVQDPQGTREHISKYLEIEAETVTVNPTLLGGAFGRKSKPDFVLEAVELSKRLQRPIRVQWTREDDIQYDYYHAPNGQLYKASLGDDGLPTAWIQRTVFPSLASTFGPFATPQGFELAMGFANTPYRFPNQRFQYAGLVPGVRIGWLRSVCNVFHAFGANVFVDELAIEAGIDPIDYRLRIWPKSGKLETLTDKPDPGYELDYARLRHVLGKVREISDWDQARADGRALGVAVHHSFYSYVATVIEVERDVSPLKAKHAWVVLDCGTYVNPDTCRAQMEGSVVFGLSIAAKGKITVEQGSIQQSNFDTYPVIRMSEAPDVEVHLVDSSQPPTGVGEPGVPTVPPAYCNAVFAATGIRHRSLPIS